MRVTDLVRYLNERGIFPYVEEGRLKTRSESAVVDAETVGRIREHKDALIRFLSEDSLAGGVAPIARIADRDAPSVLSFAQQRLWFIDQLEGGSAQYNITMVLRLAGTLDIAALQRTLDSLVARHEVLRTGFVRVDGEVLQQVYPAAAVPLQQTDLQSLDAAAQAGELERLANEDANRSFELSAALLLRARVIRLAPQLQVLMFATHHIASDGWSKGILLREFCALYTAFCSGQPDPLPPLPVQYRDFARWQRDALRGEALQREQDWWAAQLAGAPPVHALPLSHARPPQQTFRGGMHQARLPAALVARLRERCAAADMTPYVFLQLVFALLIARYSNENDVVVGTPVSGRVHPDIEPLVGFFVNTLVLRTRIDPRQPFADLLAASRQSVLDAFGHQALPFEMLVDALKPERSLSYSPLFQILFSYHNSGQGELRLPGLDVEAPALADNINQFDIEFNVADEGDTLLTAWSYNRTLFDAAAIARLSDSYAVLLHAALDQPHCAVADLPLLAPQETQRLRELGEGETRAYRDDLCLQQLFEQQAMRTPAAAAVVAADETLSYAAINERANRLAHYLIERGVARGARVGICLRRSPDMVVALLGVMKAGAAYVPLAPELPSDRLSFLLADAGIELVLTHSEFWSALPLDDREALPLDLSDGLLQDYATTNPEPAALGLTPADACYVIYTSGSTGQPKGVVVPHRGVVNYLEYAAREYLREDIAGALVATPFGFDATVTPLMLPWLAGKPSVLLADDSAACLAQLLDYAASPQPWLFKLTPAHLDAMAHLYATAPSPTAHVLVVGGEQLTRRSLQRLRAQVLPQAVVINEYGPTETVVGCSIHRCEPGDSASADAVSIGRPIANTHLSVLDEAGQPVPVGVAGELYIGGAGVTLGYLNRDALTAQKFPADPLRPGARCYRSGDLVRWLADGTLEFVGRSDDQVKVNGFRVELGEIESVLARHADVEACCVAVRADGDGRGRLVGYVVPRASILASADDESEIQRWKFERIAGLREFLRGSLPEFMQPAVYVLLDALPLSANNKLDRAALPPPDENDFEKESYCAPRDALEHALVAIWQDVLGLARIGIDDHFFRLGGHSLLATRVVSEIADRLQRRVPVRALFEHPSVRALAARLAQESATTATRIAAAPAGALALSFAQQRLWFIDQLEGGSRQYHIAAALRLDGVLDADALRRALDTIVQRHHVLRTRFVAVDGAATLQLDDEGRAGFATSDLRTVESAAQERELRALIAQETAQPFDLSRDTLLRCRLVRLGEHCHVAVLTVHHIASDGWSTALLVREFSALYAAQRDGRADPLPPLALQYADFAHWQREQLQGEALRQHLDFWREQLRDLPRVHGLPLDRPRPAQQRFSGGRVVHDIGAPLTRQLHALAQRHGASLFMLLQSAFALLVGRWSDETDVVMGSPVAGRVAREVEPLIGFFINNLVLRTDLSGNPCFGELLTRNRERFLEASAHQLLPFDLLVDALKPERSLNHAPLFQLSFSFHNLESAELSLPGLRIEHLPSGGDIARFDIELHISEIDDGLHVRWLYADSLFDAATVQRFAQSFEVLLAGIVAAPQLPVQSLPLLPAADADRLAQWSEGPKIDIPALCAHEWFQQRAQATPDALAVSVDGETLSYAQLNAQANEIAHYLIGQGVKPDALVGLCVERSLDMLLGVLGILKAGAAYLPLDPEYPPERIADMLADARVEHVLTQTGVLEALPLLGECSVLPLDGAMRELLLAGCAQTDPVGVTPDNLAYAIYTSGSTGKPKGVLLEHRGLVNLALNQQRLLDLDATSRVLAFASLSFDGSAWEWIMALASGASLHICRSEQRRSATALADFLVAQRITHAAIPPALLAQVDATRDYALKVLIVAGEACEESLAWTWAQRCRVCNSYGPSEATVAATHADIRSGERITLGTALANVELQVLNANGQPQPVGVAGELYLGGAGLARGYLDRAELQAQRFVAAAHGTPRRLYRTGDRVAWTSSGELLFLGRVDDQVKIRGFRIELGEIESRLLRHEAVREAVVVVREDHATPRLVAYVVCADTDTLSNEALLAKEWRRHLKLSLPDYMLPAAFVVLDRLPLTRNGKVDKRKLPEPDYQAQQVYVAPETATERTLAAIWQQVLRVEQVGLHDNFFEIGGDSILSIQVVSRANQAGIGITTKQLFEAQTVAELARLAANGCLVQAPQEAVDGAFSLLPIDHLFLTGELRDRHHYNQAVLLETPAGFDAGALHAVIGAVYARHDALRLRFAEREGQWQAHHAALDDAMIVASCHEETAPDDADLAEFVTARCAHWQAAFDLAAGPLLRAVYFPAAQAGSARLLLLAHHIVVDGVSWRVLLADVEQAYAHYRSGAAIALAPKTSSYQQWGAALAGYAHSSALLAEKAYWLAQCGERVAPLPVDRNTAGPGAIATTRTVAISLDAEETRALQQECPAVYRTQINELLLAGVYLGVRRWSGERTLRLRLEGHGREQLFDGMDLTQTVGWFTSVYPLRLHSDDADAGTVIKTVKEQCRAIPHHGIGYGILRYLSGDADIVAASADNEPELEFNYLGQFDQVLNAETAFKAAPESVGPKIGPRRARMHHLGLSGKTFGGELHFVLDYSSEQYDDATMQQLADLIGDGLRDVIAHCRERGAGAYTPSDFPLAQTGQAQLDRWQAAYPALARLYPATPLQAGLLFESLLRPATYVVQTFPLLRGDLDVAAFRRAWQQVIARHDIFRTAFVGEGDAVHQLVSARAELPWHEEDWRSLDAREQEQRFDAYRAQDRERGFDFATAPLLRIALFRYGHDRYQLLWTHHHILSDGWSSPLVYRDVIALYQADREGRDAGLAPAPVYETYIAWQRRQDRAAARDYWRGVLGDIEAPTPLSIERTADAGERGAREQRLTLDATQTQALQQLAQRLHTTLNTLVQWGWGYLLHRYSGERDVVFGATISGRSAEVPGIEDMVGLFINTIPVKLSFDAGDDVAASLAQLHREFQDGAAAGYLSLSDIQRQSRVRPGTSLFDSLLVFENLPIDARLQAETAKPALQVERGGSEQHTQYALTLIAVIGAELQIRCSYEAARFGETAVARLLQHLGQVLDRLPAMALRGASAPLLQTEAERAELAAWNATAADYDRDACIHRLFAAQAARTPEAIALVLQDQRLSYAQLDARANRLAHYLIAHGVRPDNRVGLCVERSFDLVIGLLAVLKAGAAYVPLDPAYPPARIAYLIQDSGVDFVLTQAHLERGLAGERVRAVLIDDEVAFAAYPESSIVANAADVSGDCPAVVMYTSGSTGRPKGVQLAHRTLVNLMQGMARRHETLAAVVPTLQFASMNFDMSLYEITSALFTGSTLVLLAEEDRLDLPRLIGVLQRHAVGRVYLPTAMLNAFAQAVLAADAALPQLRVLQVAGEQLAITPAVRAWAARGDCLLLNLYGPTESHVVTEHALHGDPAQWPALPPIGRPVDNVQIHILDAQHRPLPVGVTGELYIGGDNLALGYLGRDELTAEKFLDVEVAGSGRQRLYRTGDLARRQSDGSIDYVGRADSQVKLRGFRVEPGEIETVLASHEHVAEAVVVALGDGEDRQLVAYVVGRASSDDTTLPAQLREFLQRELPHYMVPAVFVPLAALPLTPNGKVDRRALPSPQRVEQPDFVAPSTPTQIRLAGIWQQILKIDRVGANERFFELGGHSLLATRVVAAVLTEFGCVLRLQDLFAYQGLSELAQLIDLLEQPAGNEGGTAASAGAEELEETEW